jgi:hypothetical protein
MKSNSVPKLGSGAYILTSTLPEAYRTAAILTPSKVPSAEEESIYAGFYTMVISLIWLNGGELSEQKLRRYLTRLNADQNVGAEKTETILKRLERQTYVIRKAERPPIGQDGEQTVTWHVGPRGKEEVGLDGVLGFAREVYGEDATPELEKKLRSSLGIKDDAVENAGEDEAEEGGASRAQS